MSYEDTKCPCGGKKESGTMICMTCVDAFKDTNEFRTMNEKEWPVETRRRAAIILLTMSRRRTKRQTAGFLQ